MNFFGGPLWSHGGDWADREKGVVTFQRPEGVASPTPYPVVLSVSPAQVRPGEALTITWSVPR